MHVIAGAHRRVDNMQLQWMVMVFEGGDEGVEQKRDDKAGLENTHQSSQYCNDIL